MTNTQEIMSYELYKAARLLANVIHACIKAEKSLYPTVEDLRSESVNPYYFPIDSEGLRVRCLFDMPVSLLTPCGEWVIVGEFYEGVDGDFVRKRLIKNVESRVGMSLLSEWKDDNGCVIGHVYVVEEIGGAVLPGIGGSGQHRRSTPEFVQEAEETWRRHTARYFKEMSQK